ncbi:hypothetical protein KRP22_014606 [Phytophthora ramorum]|nr:RxLR effector protein [Phytophthora ramorum]
MRSFFVLLLTLATVLACSSDVEAATSTSARSINKFESTFKRALRSETKTNVDTSEEEERIVPAPTWLTKFRVWKLKREAGFQLSKTPKQLQKEAEKAKKELLKEKKEYDQWLAAKISPETIYTKLGLTNLGAKASESSNFRRHQAYMKIFKDRAQAGGKDASWIRKWLINYRLGKLKSKAATEMKKADKQLVKEKEEYDRWLDAGFKPNYMYEKLGLKELGSKAPDSINYRRWQEYSKLWDDAKKANVAS